MNPMCGGYSSCILIGLSGKLVWNAVVRIDLCVRCEGGRKMTEFRHEWMACDSNMYCQGVSERGNMAAKAVCVIVSKDGIIFFDVS